MTIIVILHQSPESNGCEETMDIINIATQYP